MLKRCCRVVLGSSVGVKPNISKLANLGNNVFNHCSFVKILGYHVVAGHQCDDILLVLVSMSLWVFLRHVHARS